jgi:peptide alpha-N-acetyltransferase
MPQPLNSKDGASFRQLVKLYEAKQHKKAIKTADAILKKNSNHGETMAMKALTLNTMGNTDEGILFHLSCDITREINSPQHSRWQNKRSTQT